MVEGVRIFETGAKRDSSTDKPYVHNLLGYTRLRFGYHMTQGANKYGDSNWILGMPIPQYFESMDRHLAKYLYNMRRGVPQEEDHLSAIIFGAQGVMLEEEKLGIRPDQYFKYATHGTSS